MSCRHCKTAFNLTNKIPRILPQCGHSMCQECIYSHIVKSKGGYECPVDGVLFIY